jgi:O-antigen ligase
MAFIGSIAGIALLVAMNFVFNPLGFTKIDQLKKTELKVTDKKGERNLFTLRLAKWKTSLQVFSTAPLFGVTNGSYKERLIAQYLENDFTYSAQEQYSSHNQFLYTLVSNGIVGVLVLLALLLIPLAQHPWAEYLPFMLLMCVFFLTEDILSRQQGIVFFVFFYMVLTTGFSNSNSGGR